MAILNCVQIIDRRTLNVDVGRKTRVGERPLTGRIRCVTDFKVLVTGASPQHLYSIATSPAPPVLRSDSGQPLVGKLVLYNSISPAGYRDESIAITIVVMARLHECSRTQQQAGMFISSRKSYCPLTDYLVRQAVMTLFLRSTINCRNRACIYGALDST